MYILEYHHAIKQHGLETWGICSSTCIYYVHCTINARQITWLLKSCTPYYRSASFFPLPVLDARVSGHPQLLTYSP